MTRYARNTDPQTSHIAAHKVDAKTPKSVPNGNDLPTAIEKLVYTTLIYEGPMTTVELASVIGVPRDSISPRMPSLVEQGLVEDSGARRVNEGSNRKCIVWKAIIKPPRKDAVQDDLFK